MVKVNKYVLEKEIEYLSQLQEREKFNYNIKLNGFLKTTAIAISSFLTLSAIILTIFISYGLVVLGAWIVVSVFIVMGIFVIRSSSKTKKDIEKIRKNFKKRQMKIKKKYIDLIGEEKVNKLK